MKKIARMILFSSLALYGTSLWNRGVTLPSTTGDFVQAILLLAVTSYLIIPISKVVFLPLNVLTLGFLSIFLYAGLFYILDTYLQLIDVQSWILPRLSFAGITVQSMSVSQTGNLFLLAISVSLIINTLERIT